MKLKTVKKNTIQMTNWRIDYVLNTFFPKNKSIPVFLRQCLKCHKYKFWVYKNKKKEGDENDRRT